MAQKIKNIKEKKSQEWTVAHTRHISIERNAYNVEIIQEMKQTTGNDFINLFLVGLKDGLYKLKLTAVS